jgi:ribosomal protein S18 acetylase RimI-like enzyme
MLKRLDLQKKKTKTSIISGDESMLDSIAPLWMLLNQHLLQMSKGFKQDYQDMTFEKRKAALLKKAQNGKMRIDIAIDNGQKVGYCVSSINDSKQGEIESIFVEAAHRSLNIGDTLIKNALDWMDTQGAVTKIVEVCTGNEVAFSFYARYGFLPRKTVLKQTRHSS